MSKARNILITLVCIGAASVVALVLSACSLESLSCAYDQSPEDRGQPAWSPDGRRVAFVKGIDVYLINVDGTHMRRLTHGSCYGYSNPSWSPGGKSLVLEAGDDEVDVADRESSIAVLDVRTARRREGDGPRAFRVNGFAPSLSPDGRWVATGVDSGSLRAVEIYRLKTREVEWVADRYVGEAPNQPRWSSDGREIVFASDKGLYIVPVKRGRPKKILDHGKSPAWAPVGNRIAFSTDGAIGLIDRDGSLLAPAYKCSECKVHDPDWSPDGKRLAFYEEGVGIRIVSLGGKRVRTLAKV